MPDPAYTFVSQGPPVGYLRYRDLGSGAMLTGTFGHTCAIAALEDGLPVPPDSRWSPAGSDAAEGAQAAAEAQAAAPSAAPKGKAPRANGDTAIPDGSESAPGGEN